MTRNAATVRLRVETFDRLCEQKGWHRDMDRAAGIGISQSVISGIRSGTNNPGAKFINQCLATFGAPAYDALFYVEGGQS